MPPQSASVKEPCTRCREKHAKCDDQRPRCKPCQSKNLDCVRPVKETVFRFWSAESSGGTTAKDENQSNSSKRRRSNANAAIDANVHINRSAESGETPVRQPGHEPVTTPCSTAGPKDQVSISSPPDQVVSNASLHQSGIVLDTHCSPQHTISDPLTNDSFSQDTPVGTESASTTTYEQQPYVSPVATTVNSDGLAKNISYCSPSSAFTFYHPSPNAQTPIATQHHRVHPRDDDIIPTSIEDIQEACLIRFYTYELAHWFDLCDPQRHFQLVVPKRALTCAPLRNAIFAVSSRRLYLLPQHRTPHGITYHGQLLPHLTSYTSVEYMLKCIPALSTFHEVQDSEYRENIMAATALLRQYEELFDEELDSNPRMNMAGDDQAERAHVATQHQYVNFISITKAIIESKVPSYTMSSLANSVFWMTLRQEIFHSLSEERAPWTSFSLVDRCGISSANAMVLFAGEVISWWWGERSTSEWERLKAQQHQLMRDRLPDLTPFLEKGPDKARGEIFPTIWYGSDIDFTGVQHFDLGCAMLTAENPNLGSNAPHFRAAQRKAEAQVRSIILKLCGIALNHLHSPPALVTAAMGIMLYGEYFTEPREREALLDIVGKTERMRAWSMRRVYEKLKMKWDVVDSM